MSWHALRIGIIDPAAFIVRKCNTVANDDSQGGGGGTGKGNVSRWIADRHSAIDRGLNVVAVQYVKAQDLFVAESSLEQTILWLGLPLNQRRCLR